MDIQGTVRDVLQNKGEKVWSTKPDATVYQALGLMGEKNIGALVVLNDKSEVMGVLSERDYSRKVVLQGRKSSDTLVSDIISTPVVTVKEQDGIGQCLQLMTRNRVRHLPVVADNGSLVGLISMGDLVKWVIDSQTSTIRQLQGYISGDYPG
jgi:CBS domain-containing protein